MHISVHFTELLDDSARELYNRAACLALETVTADDILLAHQAPGPGLRPATTPAPPAGDLAAQVRQRSHQRARAVLRSELVDAALATAGIIPYSSFRAFLFDLTTLLRQRYRGACRYISGKSTAKELRQHLLAVKSLQKAMQMRRTYSPWVDSDPINALGRDCELDLLEAQIVVALFAHEIYLVYPSDANSPNLRDLMLTFAITDPQGCARTLRAANQLIDADLCESNRSPVERLFEPLQLSESCSASLYRGLALCSAPIVDDALLDDHLAHELLDAEAIFTAHQVAGVRGGGA